MKKTIQDLKIGDSIYWLENSDSVHISVTKIEHLSLTQLKDNKGNQYVFRSEDRTRWEFDLSACYSSSKVYKCVLDRKDLLETVLKNAEIYLQKRKEEFEKYLENINNAQKKVLEIHFEINLKKH